MRVWSLAGLAVVTASMLGCGGSDAGTGTGPSACGNASASSAVNVCDNSFGPSTMTVPAGTTVTWTWRGTNAHDVAFAGGPTSGAQTSGTFTRVFTTAGSYDYNCTIHGAAMSGRIVVQ